MTTQKKRHFLAISRVAGAALLCLGARAHAAAVVGMAISVKGAPMVVDAQSARRLRLSDRVEAGDKIRCVGGSEAVVVLFGNSKRFIIAAGKTGVVGKDNISGATAQAALGGASESAAKVLAGSKKGAELSRRTRAPERSFPWSPSGKTFLGWLVAGAQTFTWPKATEAAQYNFTLIDENNEVVFNARPTENSIAYPDAAPAIELNHPYVWRLSYLNNPTGNKLSVYNRSWGLLTWVYAADAQALSELVGNKSTQEIGNGDVTTALLTAAAFEDKGVYQNALEILDALNARQPAVPGAFDALMRLYGKLPATARAYGPYETQYAVWKFRTK